MSFTRRYLAVQLSLPLLLALPVSLLFLRHVMSLSGDRWIGLVVTAYASYLAGSVVFAAAVARTTRELEKLMASSRDASDCASRCLRSTEISSLILWVALGFLQAAIGAFTILPTFLGAQYFAEAVLIVATPTMAWSYWTGKRMIVGYAEGVLTEGYTLPAWSVGAKIAMVFLGFFTVSCGAIVLVISSRIAQTLGEEAAYSIAGFSLAVLVATSAVFGAATYFLARDITAPMRNLVTLAQDMAEGRFDLEPRIYSDDEVGVLARAFATTRQTLRMLIGRVRSTGGAITTGVATMTAGTKSLIDGAHEQTGLAEESTEALRRVRDDAKSVLEDVERVTDKTSDSASRAAELRASFFEVSQRADELFQSVEKSSSAATEIDAAAAEMARRTSDLTGVGSGVLAFVAEMDATVAQISRTAGATAQFAQEVRQNALDGRAAVEATVEGIRSAQESTRRTASTFEALQKSLGQIDQILEFINEVTNKTNLLALNAAIIAAHAGKDDYGFSVVADEVRDLSDRTRAATKEVSAILRNVRPMTRQAFVALEEGVNSVDSTVALANKASSALETILTNADRSLEMTHAISGSLQEQARGSQHLHNIIGEMTDNLSEMERATEGQAEATRMLALESERVSDIAQQVRRATQEQTQVEEGIARAMESIAEDIRTIRDRLENQLQQTQHIATNSNETLTIAHRNNGIADEFGLSLRDLLHQGEEFATAVARFHA
jgi:methyl-accepting chemotaxis protein